jgi:hypothetical protein
MTQGHTRAIRIAAWVAATLAAAFYFFQYSTLAPNHTDEALIIGYIDDMAHGKLPFYDFIDAYGLFNWIFPVAFYRAFGDTVWGIRMWMLVLKLITTALTYLLVRRLTMAPDSGGDSNDQRGGRFYAAFAAIFVAILVGVPWQAQQTAYASHTSTALVLAAWNFILCPPLRKPKHNVYAAGVLTAITIWTKLNTGMYLLAGGLFAYFFWIPVSFDGARDADGTERALSGAESASRRALFRRARIAGGFLYLVAFGAFVRRHFNVWFFLYLAVPLLIGVGFTLRTVAFSKSDDSPRSDQHVRPWLVYLLVSVGLSFFVLISYYGEHANLYLRELSGILKTIDYTAPFPALGVQSYYIGLNDYYWLELPWFLTALFALWVWLGSFRGRGVLAFGDAWPARRARLGSLFVLSTLHTFVMYARSDEIHICQALVLVLPVIFVVLADLDEFSHAKSAAVRFPVRLAMVGFGFFYGQSLFVTPTLDSLRIGFSEWRNPALVHLRYREKFSPYVRDASPNLFDRDWDEAEDQAGAYVKSISVPGEEILLLTANRLLNYDSNTRPQGGRYHFLFYLASVGLLDRDGFDALVPPVVIGDILRHPPRVIVSSMGNVPLQNVFPEFRRLRDTYYVKTRGFRHILIYELRILGKPLAVPARTPKPYTIE